MEQFALAIVNLCGERRIIENCTASMTILALKQKADEAFDTTGHSDLSLGTTLLENVATLADAGVSGGAELTITRSPSILVIDNGSETLRAGFAGDSEPVAQFPCIFGSPKAGVELPGEMAEFYIGEEALAMRGNLRLTYPIEHGVVTNWDHMEKIWHHTFYRELRVTPEDHPVLLTEKPLNAKANREKMTQVMFETFRVPKLAVALSEMLSLYSAGRVTGLVTEVGAGVAHCVPIIEGHAVYHAITRFNLAGRDLTDYLVGRLREYDLSYASSEGRVLVCELKEKHCHMALNYDAEIRALEPGVREDYVLSSGQVVSVPKDVLFSVPEVLLSPCMVGFSMPGLHDFIYQSITKVDVDSRKDMYGNVVLSGGSALFPGFRERIAKELEAITPPTAKIKVIAATPTRLAAWTGGSVMASLQASAGVFMTAADYDEKGPACIHDKCL